MLRLSRVAAVAWPLLVAMRERASNNLFKLDRWLVRCHSTSDCLQSDNALHTISGAVKKSKKKFFSTHHFGSARGAEGGSTLDAPPPHHNLVGDTLLLLLLLLLPTMMMSSLSSLTLPTAAMALYLAELILTVVAPNAPRLFLPRYGRRHRTAGAVYLALLVLGLTDLAVGRRRDGGGGGGGGGANNAFEEERGLLLDCTGRFLFDVTLGVAGVALALTAAFDFRVAHTRVTNVASGPLDASATVTFSEMLEHSFYQGVNLVQVVYLHCVWRVPSHQLWLRLLMLTAAGPYTSPLLSVSQLNLSPDASLDLHVTTATCVSPPKECSSSQLNLSPVHASLLRTPSNHHSSYPPSVKECSRQVKR